MAAFRSGGTMARRQRDYRAEYARRQELARERGFRTYGQQRHRIETGKAPALQPSRIRSLRTREAQKQYETPQVSRSVFGWARAGFPSEYAYRKARDEALDYSAAHAHRQIAMYDPEGNAPDVDRYTYLQAYTDAFVRGPQRYGAVRRTGGSEALRRYFVDITHYYSPDEYEVRYGHDSPISRRA